MRAQFFCAHFLLPGSGGPLCTDQQHPLLNCLPLLPDSVHLCQSRSPHSKTTFDVSGVRIHPRFQFNSQRPWSSRASHLCFGNLCFSLLGCRE
ncbi:hypothetical protein VTH06DRAFT_3851 [Thermothelomyces fergusii]